MHRAATLALLTSLLVSAAASAQQLKVQRDLLIGEIEGEPHLEFARVRAVGVGADGTLFVGDQGSMQIRVFTTDGRFLRAFGSKGKGPGEFETIAKITTHGDTVFALDGQLLRTIGFSREGKVLVNWPIGEFGARQTYPVEPAPGGWIVQPLTSAINQRPKAGEVKVTEWEVGFTAGPPRGAATPVTSLVKYEVARTTGVSTTGGMWDTRPVFAVDARHAADQRGNVYVMHSDAYRVDTYDLKGKLVRTIERKVPPVRVTNEHIASYRRAVDSYPKSPSGAVAQEVRDGFDARLQLPKPTQLPPLSQMFVSSAGTVWVERFDLSPEPGNFYSAKPLPVSSYWDVFDPNGRFRGTVELPPRFRMRAVTENHAIGVLRDEDDVEFIARYAIRG